MSQLNSIDQFKLDQAKRVLEACSQNFDPNTYARQLGKLEIVLGNMIKLVDQLTSNT